MTMPAANQPASATTISDRRLVHPFVGRDLPWLLDDRTDRQPAKTFLVWEPFVGSPAALSYADVAERTRSLAAGMHRRGVRPADRVLLHLDNCPEFVLAWFACARLGAVAVTTNTRSSSAELSWMIEHSNPVAAVTQPRHQDMVSALLPGARWIATVDTDPVETTSGSPIDVAFAALHDEDGSPPSLQPDPTRPLSVQYTSGTTSRPKGVVWTHANALWGARLMASSEGLVSTDVHHLFAPLFHANALVYSLLASLWAGATCVVQPKFSRSRFWDVALRNRCTWASVPGFAARALVEQDVPDHHFRAWGVGAGDLPFDSELGLRTFGWWGMTETVGTPIISDLDAPTTPWSLGRPRPEYDIVVVDDAGEPAEAGTIGALRVRGVRGLSLFAEYLDDPEATRAAFDERGHLVTGDLVVVDEDGCLTFAGRDKDMMKVGGENVAESEVERVISEVTGVREVAVVGAPDPMYDEVPWAFVTVAAHAPVSVVDDIVARCAAQLADFKRPRGIEVVDDLPRSLLGKVAKNQLRAGLRQGTAAET